MRAIEFIEIPAFTRQFQLLAGDDELRKLQVELIANPLQGSLIANTGGLRKIRVALPHQGKRGALRVIYLSVKAERIYLIYAYQKNAQDNLSAQEKLILKRLVSELKGEAE
jgi:hypothetical protein